MKGNGSVYLGKILLGQTNRQILRNLDPKASTQPNLCARGKPSTMVTTRVASRDTQLVIFMRKVNLLMLAQYHW